MHAYGKPMTAAYSYYLRIWLPDKLYREPSKPIHFVSRKLSKYFELSVSNFVSSGISQRGYVHNLMDVFLDSKPQWS